MELIAEHAERDHRDHRLPVRRGPDPAAARTSTTRRSRSPAAYQDIFGKENYFLELMDHGLDIEREVRDGSAAAGQGARHPAAGHQRRALRHRGPGRRARQPAVHRRRQEQGRPEPVPVQRLRLLPQDRRRDAGAVLRAAGGLRQHPADRRAHRVDYNEVFDHVDRDAAVPRRARGRDPGVVAAQGGARRGLEHALRRPDPGTRSWSGSRPR